MAKHDLAGRVRSVRQHFGLTQKAMAAKVGSSLAAWQQYEAAKAAPGYLVLAALVDLGIDGTWLITGKGEMLPEDLPTEAVELDLLETSIDVVEQLLIEFDREADPARKAKLVSLIYERELALRADGRGPDTADVIRLFKQVV